MVLKLNKALYGQRESPRLWGQHIQNGLERSELIRRLTDKVQEVEKAHGELMSIQNDLLKVFI